MLLRQPASILTLSSHTTHLWKTTLGKVYLTAFLCTVIPVCFSQYILMQTALSLLIVIDIQNNFHISYHSVLLILLSILVSMGSYATLLTYINSIIKHQPLSGIALIKTILIKTPLLLVALLLSAASFILGSIMFLIPGIYVIGVIFLFYPIVILESDNPLKDLGTAFRLIRNNWWRTFFALALPIILFTSCISSFAIFLSSLLPPIDHEYWRILIKLITQVLLLSFFFPWICIQILSLLNDLKMRKGLSNTH